MSIAESDLQQLIARRVEGHALEQAFYCAPEIFAADMERIVMPMWHLVDHVSRISKPGDFFVCEMAGESIIVARDRKGEVRAFFNVCRHRGSRVCRESHGNTTAFVCPYHAWTYNLDGSLRAAQMVYESFDKSRHGLHACHVRVCEGLIFICMNPGEPPDFEEMFGPLRPYAAIQDMANAKIAHRASYAAGGNWKLVVENFFECYHCLSAHPQYCTVHPKDFILALTGDRGEDPNDYFLAFQPQRQAFEEKTRALGHPAGQVMTDPLSMHWSRGGRHPIQAGWLSETRDGAPAAPLMGHYKDWDGGFTGMVFSPLSIVLATNDFVTILRFVPHGPRFTDVDAIWLVRSDAVEGKDYDVQKMIWMWDVTLRQDKQIIEDNQAGILSRAYRPGPYTRQEKNANRAVQWYLHRLSRSA